MRGLTIKIEQGNGEYFWSVDWLERDGERKEMLGVTENIYESLRDVRNIIAPLVTRKNGKLTARQTEILLLLVQGKTYKVVAAELGITIKTVKDTMSSVRRKLSCQNSVQAIYTAIVLGYLP